jgi:pimeloyl-ACP methyl ester carboxylesterase
MEERTLEAGERRFRYLERPGKGTPLLFLHGLGDSADQFEPIAARLPGGWHLLALDQRGHGGSFKPPGAYSPPDFADDTKVFLDALGVPSAHLFGHSMGGRNALVLAARSPERARSLILGDIGPDENLADIEGTRSFFESLPDSFATAAEARAHYLERKPGYSEESLGLLMRNLEAAPDGSLRWRYSMPACIAAVTAARSRDWWEFLPRVRCPFLLLHVEGSGELSDEVAGRMRREAPHMSYVRIPDSGHNFQLENPVRAAAEITRFVEGLPATDSPGLPTAGSGTVRC